MRLAFLAYRGAMTSGGQGIYLSNLTRELARRGHVIDCFVGPPYPDPMPWARVTHIENQQFWGRSFEKFPGSDSTLTIQMKSVGETMAIGRTFKEALQKALRSLEIGHSGLGWDHKDAAARNELPAIEEIRLRVATEVSTDFEALTAHLDRPVEVVAYFLAVLELARWGLLKASQETADAAIVIDHVKDAEGELVSEWQQ